MVGQRPASDDDAPLLDETEFARKFWMGEERPDNWPVSVPFPTNFRVADPKGRRHLRAVKERSEVWW